MKAEQVDQALYQKFVTEGARPQDSESWRTYDTWPARRGRRGESVRLPPGARTEGIGAEDRSTRSTATSGARVSPRRQ